MSLASGVRRAVQSVARGFGFKIVRRTPLLWLAGSIDMKEPWVRKLRAARPVRTVFDVGANDGKSALWMRQTFPDATVYSFEPFEPSFRRLEAAVGADPRVRLFSIALGERNGPATYHANSSAGTGSLLPNSPLISTFAPPQMVSPRGQTTVAVERLDTFCEREGIERIDVLKIDAQGYEKRILEGAGDMLRPDRVGGLFLEMNFVELYEGQAWADELMGMLRERGYRLYGFSGPNFSRKQGWRWADAMFIPSEASSPSSGPG